MSTFTATDINTKYINPYRMIGKEWFALTAEKDGQVNTMTAGWGGLGVMWGKNVAFVVVRDSRYTKEFIDSSDSFSLTFFENTPDNKKMLSYIGSTSGRDEDKIANANLTIDYHEGTPYINEGNMVYICKKMYKAPMPQEYFTDMGIDSAWYKNGDYHNLYIGEITALLTKKS